jgi:lipooligosaccharide transport system ATP-binding protein
VRRHQRHGRRPDHRRGSPRELIAGHIEPHVVEIYGDGAGEGKPREAQAFSAAARVRPAKPCSATPTMPAPLLAHLAAWPGLRYLHRPANLEDVFLKLTGRDLRD